MKIVALRLFGRTYLCDEIFNEEFGTLGELLSSDVGPCRGSFIRFLEDPDDHVTIRNYSCVIKDEDDILLSCQFDEDPYENCIRIPRKEFISILNQWDKLMDQDPQEIIVYKEGELYRLEGHGFSDKKG